MNNVLFENYSDALTMEADIVERERERSFNVYLTNNEYITKMYIEALQLHFEKLKAKWLSDTRLNSNSYLSTQHPAYLKILSFGQHIVPFLIRDLRDNKIHWFLALSTLTGVNPIQEQHAGKIDDMIADWLRWGEQNGMI
jgi:hypothetical protein